MPEVTLGGNKWKILGERVASLRYSSYIYEVNKR
tara:strand:- start:1967 stop:2068 length:102 start_codon:yes stop_codon:yes gene_type:complete